MANNRRRLTRDRAKALIASGLQRAVTKHGMEAVAMEAGCKETCLRSALAHKSLPELHYAFNAMLLDPTVLDEMAASVGYCLVPLEIEAETDMETLAELSSLLAEWLQSVKD